MERPISKRRKLQADAAEHGVACSKLLAKVAIYGRVSTANKNRLAHGRQ